MTNEEKAMEEEKMTDKEKIRTEDLEKVAIQQCYELLKDETIVIDGYEFINRFRKAMGKKINMCGECKWFSCDDRGRCICTKKEWGNWKASPNVCACFNYFERKEF